MVCGAERRPRFFKPMIGLERGLTDPIVDLNMGQTAEIVAHFFKVNRAETDTYAVESHRRLARAQDEDWLRNEVEPLFPRDGELHDHGDGVRRDSTVHRLTKLQPAFEPP